jgi:hypothetical protein
MAGTHRIGKKRTADVIAAEIEATCLNITANVAALEKYVKPANLAAKGMGSAGAFFLDEDGELRVERVVAVSAAGIGLLGLLTRSRKN